MEANEIIAWKTLNYNYMMLLFDFKLYLWKISEKQVNCLRSKFSTARNYQQWDFLCSFERVLTYSIYYLSFQVIAEPLYF